MPLTAGRAADPFSVVGNPLPTRLRDGVPIEVVSKILGHGSVVVTSAIYGHLTVADARRALEAAGWFTGSEVSV